MFRNFQISEYTIQKGYLHTIITGSISHQDIGHLLPNLLGYFLFGKLIEKKFGSRKTFYLMLYSSIGSIISIIILEKLLTDSVGLIIPKCNGSVPAISLAVATGFTSPMIYFNPLQLKRSLKNELLMMPMFVPVALFLMVEYYEWKQGYVEYICNQYLARPGHIAAGLTALLFSFLYLR